MPRGRVRRRPGRLTWPTRCWSRAEPGSSPSGASSSCSARATTCARRSATTDGPASFGPRWAGSGDPGDRLTLAVADLTADAGWAEAVDGCRFVLHVASPLAGTTPPTPTPSIVPARDGTLRVLRAAPPPGSSGVVLTSAANAASPTSYDGGQRHGRDAVDRSRPAGPPRLPTIEDHRRAGSVGVHGAVGRRHDAGDGAAGCRLRPDPHHRQHRVGGGDRAAAQRGDGGYTKDRPRGGRRARPRRPAPAGHDGPGRGEPAVPGHRRVPVDGGHRGRAARTSWETPLPGCRPPPSPTTSCA